MTFSASAARFRDVDLPLGLRARCLHECLGQFSVFGFNATRERLLVMAGLGVDDRWSEASLVNALEPLTHARRSWLAFAADDARARRADKRAGRPLSRVSEIRTSGMVSGGVAAARLTDPFGPGRAKLGTWTPTSPSPSASAATACGATAGGCPPRPVH